MYPLQTQIQIFQDTPEAKQAIFNAFKRDIEDEKLATLECFRAGMKQYGDIIKRNRSGSFMLDPAMQKVFSQAGNFPVQDSRVVQVIFEDSEEPADTTWSLLSVVDDFRGTTEDSFSMLDIRNGITFRSYQNGEKVELYPISGDEIKVPFELIGGGFQWLQTWLDDNKWWTLAQGFAEAATQYAKEVAENFYNVLMASGFQTQTRETLPAAQPAAYYDIVTINAAYVALLARMKANSNYAAPNPRMYLVYYSLEESLATRIAQIFSAEFTLADQGTIRLRPEISPLGSPNVPAGMMYLVLPGRKIRTGWRMDMTGYDKFDILTYSGARAFWGRYTHVRGDSDQVRAIPLS